MNEREQRPYQFAEKCLYDYQENLARLELLKDDLERLSSLTVTNYNAQGRGGVPGDPVWKYVQKKLDIEDGIAGLERKTAPITRMVSDLEAPWVLEGSPKMEMAKVLRMCYFGKTPREQAASNLNMAERTLRARKREVVKMAIYYLGF